MAKTNNVSWSVTAVNHRAATIAWPLCALTLAMIVVVVGLALSARFEWLNLAYGLSSATSAFVGALVASRRPTNPIGWMLLCGALCQSTGQAAVEYAYYGLRAGLFSYEQAQWLALPRGILNGIGLSLLLVYVPLLFPDGHLPSPRWRPLAWVQSGIILLLMIYVVIAPQKPQENIPITNALGIVALEPLLPLLNPAFLALFITVLLISAASMVARFRRSAGTERQQMKWLTYTISAWAALVLLTIPAEAIDARLYDFVDGLLALVFLLMPVSIGVAVLRYRLFEIDRIINRTLVYGVLTMGVISIYVLLVGFGGALFRTGDNLAISLLATGLVAVLFQPLRTRLQRSVDRLLYGERDNPYAVLSRLGQRLEASLAPDEVLPTIVQTVRDALKLPYVALAIDQDGRCTAAASVGTPVPRALRFPLVHQGTEIGTLVLGPRAPNEPFSDADQRLLHDLARQAGSAAYAVRLHADTQQLAADLQQSREQIITAREEERRRLRRDLHDGLGPSIAAQTIKAGTARYLIPRNPDAAAALLSELEGDMGRVLSEVRQLVYNLRPPALDELGLVGAIQAAAAQLQGYNGTGVQINVCAVTSLPPLPAAVEVAAYRIAHEALNNVVKHAQARHCTVRLSVRGQGSGVREALQRTTDNTPSPHPLPPSPLHCLTVEIADDGVGLPDERHVGVGLQAMRERAAELGGTCIVRVGERGGSIVEARLPFHDD